MSTQAAPARASTVSRALARDKLGMFAVLAFILAGCPSCGAQLLDLARTAWPAEIIAE